MLDAGKEPSKNLDLVVCSDSKRIKQVLMNLLSNALKFTKEGDSITIITELVKSTSKPVMKRKHVGFY